MFLNGRWLGSDQKVGVGTKYSRPEGLSVSRADYRTYLQVVLQVVLQADRQAYRQACRQACRHAGGHVGRHGATSAL